MPGTDISERSGGGGEAYLGMQYGELIDFLQNVGKDPSRLIFEDELTGLHNRRFLLSYFEHKVHWDDDQYFPLSLMIMDIDLFKSINDTYGHDSGDEALVFVAGLIKDVAGENGYPVRFGGDEFILLLPATELAAAVQSAHRLHQLTKERPLKLPKDKGEIKISLSIGVASARADASSGRDLIRMADTALYTSKKLGRNRVSVAAEADPEKTYSKTALYRLDGSQISGRSQELEAVSEALEALGRRECRFLLVEGAPGMGKTTLIEAVRKSLGANDAFRVVQAEGRPQEGFRPYYLVAQALVALMNRRPDKGAAVLDTLDERDLHNLAPVLPVLDRSDPDDSHPPFSRDDPKRREAIFVAILKLLEKLVEEKPLAVLVDDLHFADEGSLFVLKVLWTNRHIPVFVCGTSSENLRRGTDEEPFPLERFLSALGELPLQTIRLKPLTAEDIARHLAGVFPGIDLPASFENELMRTTQGNPLFLAELIRKLVLDQKLILKGQRWIVEPPDEGYFPRSLEEIVSQKLLALDVESRRMLERLSTMGQNVPLSMVSGSSEKETSETEILDFLDRAENLGLLRTDFDINDETMRFLSQRVMQLVYGSMKAERREALHEQVATYQEGLYHKKLGPSASILAYHFKRSANQDKARRYDQIQNDLRLQMFNRQEAESYSGELVEDEEGPQDEKLSPEVLARLPVLLRSMLTAVRSFQLYPPDSNPVLKAQETTFDAVAGVLEQAEHVTLSRAQGVLLANEHKLDVGDFRLLAGSFVELLDRAELERITFRRGVSAEEMKLLLDRLGQLKPELIDGDYWKRFTSEHALGRLAVRQVRYAKVTRRKARASIVPGTVTTASEMELDASDLALLPGVLRSLMSTVKAVKLYPVSSNQVRTSVDQFHGELKTLLSRRPVVTLAGAVDALIVNGMRVGTTGFEAVAGSFLALLAESELSSLTVLSHVTRGEIEAFVAAYKELPSELTPAFWQGFVREHNVQGLVFNDRRYGVSLVQTVLESVQADASMDDDGDDGPSEQSIAQEPMEALVEALPTVAKELLVNGEQKLARRMLRRVFSDYKEQDVASREKIVRACRGLMEALIQALQHQFAALAADYLLRAFREEEDDHLLAELANLLHQMTASVLQFADYTLAARIFSELRTRQRELMNTPRATGRGFAVLNRKMDAATRALLMEELQSHEPDKQQQVAQVIESMGKPAIPLLIEVVKQEKDFRTRQMAASLLGKMGREAAEMLKREIVLEVTAEQRFRIIEVIDVVTRDLKTELAFCLSDVNPKVRRAAFRLSERLADKHVLELLVDFARHEDIGVAKGAIRSLANLRSPHAVGALISNLEVSKEPERAIACAQALAQLGDPVAVPALEKVLTARKFPLWGGKRWDDQVRATAAFALAQIGGDRAKIALRRVADDSDPRIRQIVTSGIRGAPRAGLTMPDDDDESDEGVA